MKIALENKTAGGEIELNVYCQETEPENKNGIWLQTDRSYEKICVDFNVVSGEQWNTTKMSNLQAIPVECFHSLLVPNGKDVYIFGSYKNPDGSAAGSKRVYKYDTLTDTYTRLNDMPYLFNSGSGVLVNDYIYIFGASNNNWRLAYKYSIKNDTYEPIANVPFDAWDTSCVYYTENNNIYLFGGNSLSNAYRYDISLNTYIQLASIPGSSGYNFCDGAVVIYNNFIYLFGNDGGRTFRWFYKYDISSDTYINLNNSPYSYARGGVARVGNYMYMFGGFADNNYYSQYCYKYDVENNIFTRLTNIPYKFNKNFAVAVDDREIYLFGGELNPKKVQVLNINNKSYDDNSIVISQGVSKYKTKLYNTDIDLMYNFDNVWFYTTEDGLISNIPTYYGDGTQWVKFKN